MRPKRSKVRESQNELPGTYIQGVPNLFFLTIFKIGKNEQRFRRRGDKRDDTRDKAYNQERPLSPLSLTFSSGRGGGK